MNRVEFRSRLPVWLLLAVVAACAVFVHHEFGRSSADGLGWALLRVSPMALVGVIFAYGVWNRTHRPVLEIDGDGVAWGTVFQLFRWRVHLSDVAEVLPSGSGNVSLRLASGAHRKISLFEVAKTERESARQAIAEAVARA